MFGFLLFVINFLFIYFFITPWVTQKYVMKKCLCMIIQNQEIVQIKYYTYRLNRLAKPSCVCRSINFFQSLAI